eukprot:1146088-Pelagomonas_calceolata.AAC.8
MKQICRQGKDVSTPSLHSLVAPTKQNGSRCCMHERPWYGAHSTACMAEVFQDLKWRGAPCRFTGYETERYF